jgi:hypothetical protein
MKTLFSSTRDGAAYVVDQFKAVIENAHYQRDCSVTEWLAPVLDEDRYDELVGYTFDILMQYSETNTCVNSADDPTEDELTNEANDIANFIKSHLRVELVLS